MLPTHSPIQPYITLEQIEFFREQGYLLIKKGCSDDLINAFNGHIYDIRLRQKFPLY